MKKLLLVLSLVMSTAILFTACGESSVSKPSASSQDLSSIKSVSSTPIVSSVPTASSSVGPQATGFIPDSTNVRKMYVVGETFTNTGFVGKAQLDNGKTTFLTKNDYSYKTDFDSAKPGNYTVTVTYKNFEPHVYTVQVVPAPIVNAGVVKFAIDGAFTGDIGELNANEQYQLKSFTQLISLLDGVNFDATTVKQVYVAPGTYNEKISFTSKMTNVQLIAQSGQETKITYGDCSSKTGGTDSTATVTVKGDGFMAKNIIFENSYDFINGTDANKQALAALIEADKAVFDNCVFLGYQDTLQAKNKRQYYNNCTIKGTTDFIFGKSSTALFEGCDIVTRFTKAGQTNNGYITAHSGNEKIAVGTPCLNYGYVFKNCNLTAETGVEAGTVSLGRPWRWGATVAFINCDMGAHISVAEFGSGVKGRYDSMSGGGRTNLPSEAYFVEYGNTGAGALATATADFTLIEQSVADNYTIANIFAKNNNSVTYVDDWDATAALTALQAL